MKILLLNYEFPPMGGGAANATFNIAKELVKLGHSVDVLTSGIKDQSKEEVIHGFKVYRVFSWRKGIHDCGMRGAYTYVINAYLKLRHLLRYKHYDLCHYFFSLPTGLLTLLPGKHRDIPYIISLRGSDVPNYDPSNKWVEVSHCFLKPITKRIWKKAKYVIALSDGLRDIALKTAPDQEIHVIGNGVETDIFMPGRKSKTSSNDLRMIAVARLIKRKGLQHILQALHELNDPSIKLTIIGSGNYEKKLMTFSGSLGLNDLVTFYGYCTRKKLPFLYSQADIFILPSMTESFGIVFAEAMACGLPIIGSRVGGVPDLVKKQNGILISPGNVQEIKNAILTFKNNTKMMDKMSKANRKRVCRHYSWECIAEQYDEYYKKSLGLRCRKSSCAPSPLTPRDFSDLKINDAGRVREETAPCDIFN